MVILPAYVLRCLHRFFAFTKLGQEQFVASVFASYYGSRGEKSTLHRIITYPNSIPRRLILLYANPNAPHCPPLLFNDLKGNILRDGNLTASQKIALLELLLDITYELPTDAHDLIVVDYIDTVPTCDQLASICTRLLWYTICTEHKLAKLGRIA